MTAYMDHLFGEHFTLIIIRILIALVLSGLIGFEREIKNHSAGFRTHLLVGLGSCLMMLLSLYGFESFLEKYEGITNIRFDPSRIPSYVISGIGFLGAGTIIVYGGTIRGLTTAASIWAVAGIGLVVGAGMYAIALVTTVVILLSLSLLNNFEKIFTKNRSSSIIEIIARPEMKINTLVSIFENSNINIKKIEIANVESDLRNIFIKIERDVGFDRIKLFDEILKMDHIKNISDKS